MDYKKISKITVACSIFLVCILITGAVVVGAKTLPEKEEESTRTYFYSDSNGNNVKKESYEENSWLSSCYGGPYWGDWDDYEDYWEDYANDWEDYANDYTDYWDDYYNDYDYNYNYNYNSNYKKASEIYNDNSKIAGEDLTIVSSARGMRWTNGYMTANQMSLHGSNTFVVYDVKSPVNVDLTYSIKKNSGKFKIVSIDPDNKVTTLIEGEGSGKKTIELKKGRNRIKLVGNEAKVNEISVSVSDVDKNKLNAIYYSEDEEKAADLLKEIKAGGTIDFNKLITYAPNLEEKDISDCIVEWLKTGKTISSSDWKKIIPFADTDILEDYYEKELKNNKFVDFSNIEPIIPFLDDEFLTDYVLYDKKNNQKLTSTQLRKLFPFIDEDIYGSYMLENYVAGKSDINEVTTALNYLDEDDITDAILKCFKSNTARGKELLTKSVYLLDEDEIYDCLVEAIKRNVVITKTELRNFSWYMDDDDFLEIVKKCQAKNFLTSEEAKELVRYRY